MKTLQTLAAFVVAVSLTSLSARAVTETDLHVDGPGTGGHSIGAEGTYDANISNSDLLSGLPAAAFTLTAGPDYQGPKTAVADGTASSNNDGSKNLYFGVSIAGTSLKSDPVLTIALNTSVNTLGYDLTSINSIYGWQNFHSFSDQDYTISYSTVAAPTVFTLLATVAYNPFAPGGDPDEAANPQSASQVTLTNLAGAVGVADIQFAFTPYTSPAGNEQNGQMIREIDVFGTPTLTVPEPSTYALMGLGGLLLVWRLRRQSIV